MVDKTRFIFPIVITAMIVFVVSGAMTLLGGGLPNKFVLRWWRAFVVGWPIAAVTAYFAIPFARTLTQRIVVAIDRSD